MIKPLSVVSLVALAVAVTACEKKSPSAPSVTDTAGIGPESVLDARTGVTLIRPRLISPGPGEELSFGNQPITLTVANGVSTGSATLTYTFEVATDSGFGHKIFSKGGVAQGSNGQTSLAIDKLAGDTDYFWRVQVGVGGTAGPYSAVRQMRVGPEIILGVPVLASPGANGRTGQTPALTVRNVERSGPVTGIVYRFEVSTSSDFNSVIATASAREQAGGSTGGVVTTRLDPGDYFWRAQATDPGSGVIGPFSDPSPFIVQAFDINQATFYDSPRDMARWAETAKITSINITPIAFEVDFSKRTGAGHWPDVPFGAGSLEYTLGMCLNINDHWACSAVVQFWYGRDLTASTPPAYVGRNWFYDGRWGPLLGHQPRDGETVGLFVCAGNCRDHPNGDASYVKERSNVQLIPWINNGYARYTY